MPFVLLLHVRSSFMSMMPTIFLVLHIEYIDISGVRFCLPFTIVFGDSSVRLHIFTSSRFRTSSHCGSQNDDHGSMSNAEVPGAPNVSNPRLGSLNMNAAGRQGFMSPIVVRTHLMILSAVRLFLLYSFGYQCSSFFSHRLLYVRFSSTCRYCSARLEGKLAAGERLPADCCRPRSAAVIDVLLCNCRTNRRLLDISMSYILSRLI